MQVSMRYSVTYPFEEKLTTCRNRLKGMPFTVDVVSNSAPHHVDATRSVGSNVTTGVYRPYRRRWPIYSLIGGGTYARVLDKKGVAFGMLFPGREDVAHQADEYIYIDDLLKRLQFMQMRLVDLACDKSEGE